MHYALAEPPTARLSDDQAAKLSTAGDIRNTCPLHAQNPDLGAYSTTNQQPVDFAVWQAADGTWQLWSCIRNTRCGGVTRLLHGWEGRRLADTNWAPRGITMEANAEFGETPGGLQAPFVLRHDSQFLMFYGDWGHICVATSKGGKTFARRIDPNGNPGMFAWEGLVTATSVNLPIRRQRGSTSSIPERRTTAWTNESR